MLIPETCLDHANRAEGGIVPVGHDHAAACSFSSQEWVPEGEQGTPLRATLYFLERNSKPQGRNRTPTAAKPYLSMA